MKISVIISTKNEQKNIKRLLLNLRRQTFKEFEVIIVDNFSDDRTTQTASKFTNKVFQKGKERSVQRNFGLTRARGQYILFLDADMTLEDKVVEQCYQKLTKHPQLSGIVIDEISQGEGFLARLKSLEKKLTTSEELLEATRFFRKKDLEKIGGYDENMIAGEDWDLTARIRKLGKPGKIKAKICHHDTGSIITDIKKKYYYAKHIQKYAQKHHQAFKKQAGIFYRLPILFKKPRLIYNHPIEFLGLLLLKFAHYLAYLAAKINK